ncbi:MAG: DUF192 domain-containing protein [Elusimicrobia bacterium]|nr:DUF192 domain-containing protein [Elusimicrobiota bacterium]
MRLFNLTKNKVVVENLTIAKNYCERTRGLLGKKNIDEKEGLLIKNCNWIHMFFMKFPVDVIFLKTQEKGIYPVRSGTSCYDTSNGVYKVVKILDNIKPWRLSSPVFHADAVLEIKSETSKNIVSVGDELEIMEGV